MTTAAVQQADGFVDAIHASLDEAAAIRREFEQLKRDVEHIRAEYTEADEKHGSGDLPEKDFDRFDQRLGRMQDGHLWWTYLALTSLLHQRLYGKEFDLMRFAKNAQTEIWARFLTEDGYAALGEGFGFLESGDEIDLSYLDGDEA